MTTTTTTTAALMMFPHVQGLGFHHGSHERYAPHLLQGIASSLTSTGNSCGKSNSSSHHGHFPSAISGCSVAKQGEYEYDLAEEGDLFKAPEPVAEEPPDATLDPVTAALSLMSGVDLVAADDNALEIAGMGPIGSGQHLLSEFNFYKCVDGLVAPPNSESFSELLDVEAATDPDGTVQKSVISGRLDLDSMDERKVKPPPPRPTFLGLEEMGLDEAVIGMRRARSDGDIQTVGNDSGATIVSQNALHPSPASAVNKFKSEERRQKLWRYRNKRERRNFGRKIKYACRKALADNQLRVRGRFAKIKEHRVSKPVN